MKYEMNADELRMQGFQPSVFGANMLEKRIGEKIILYKKAQNGSYVKEFEDNWRLFQISLSVLDKNRNV